MVGKRFPSDQGFYQLEVKRFLVGHLFHPSEGWEVTVDIDAMELAKGGDHPADKPERASSAKNWLDGEGARIGADPEFGRVDLVARKPGIPTVLVEIEGDSKKQKEQALYSALGQVVLLMKGTGNTRYGIAVPDYAKWECHLRKIPKYVLKQLCLTLWLVSATGVRELE